MTCHENQAETANGELGRGHIQRPPLMLGQKVLQDIGQTVGLVINDVWEFHDPGLDKRLHRKRPCPPKSSPRSLRQFGLQLREILLDDMPNDLDVDAEIVVHYPVTKTNNFVPLYV